MTVRSFDELAESARRAVEAYLATIDAELVPDIEAHLLDHLDPDAELADVQRVLADLDVPTTPKPRLRGTWAGMPYDVSAPSWDKFRNAWWDPANPKIFVPRVFGAGWDLNFGAIAVRTGLIEPDAEDVPLALTPRRTLARAHLVPAALTAAIAISYLDTRRTLPPRVATKWSMSGRVRRTTTPAAAVAPPLIIATAATAASAGVLVRHRPATHSGVAVTLATLASGIAASSWAQIVMGARRDRAHAWAGPLSVLVTLGATFAMLLHLARAGRRAEIGRDLGGEPR